MLAVHDFSFVVYTLYSNLLLVEEARFVCPNILRMVLALKGVTQLSLGIFIE